MTKGVQVLLKIKRKFGNIQDPIRPVNFLRSTVYRTFEPQATLASRMMECLKQIGISDSVFCIGEAKHVRKVWKERLMGWHRLRTEVGAGPIEDFDVPNLWRPIRKANGQELYQPVRID